MTGQSRGAFRDQFVAWQTDGGHRLTNTVPKSRPFGNSNFRAGRPPPDHPGPLKRARFLRVYLVIRCDSGSRFSRREASRLNSILFLDFRMGLTDACCISICGQPIGAVPQGATNHAQQVEYSTQAVRFLGDVGRHTFLLRAWPGILHKFCR